MGEIELAEGQAAAVTVDLAVGAGNPAEQREQATIGGANALNRQQLSQHLPLPAEMLLQVGGIQLQVLNHHGGEALELQGLDHGIVRIDHIPWTPEAEGDALTIHRPAGGADIALMQPPGPAIRENIAREKGEQQGLLGQCGCHGVGGRWGGWPSAPTGSGRSEVTRIRTQQDMAGEQLPGSMAHSRWVNRC